MLNNGLQQTSVKGEFISMRFRAAALRRHLRLVDIDPSNTFNTNNTKGKDEALAYRLPISRLVQEQQEETRLLPGLERTDEAVFNVPRWGELPHVQGTPRSARHPAERRPGV